jgi:hypothetical protein
MNYPIPVSPEEILAFKEGQIDEEIIAMAIAGVVKIARQQGQSLEELTAQVMRDDSFLDQVQRKWLSDIVTQAWQAIP